MIKYYQKESYPYGDCVRTCLASILETENLEDIPNFMRDGEGKYIEHLDEWCKMKGLDRITIAWDFIHGMVEISSRYVLIFGDIRGISHATVGKLYYENNKAHIEYKHDPIRNNDFKEFNITHIQLYFGSDKFNIGAK